MNLCKNCEKEIEEYRNFCNGSCATKYQWKQNPNRKTSNGYKQTKEKIASRTEKAHTKSANEKRGLSLRGRKEDGSLRALKISKTMTGHKGYYTKEALGEKFDSIENARVKKISESMGKLWENPDYAKKVMTRKDMSRPEIDFMELIKEHDLPYFFNGNLKNKNPLIIDRKIPDIVHNTAKKLIEIWGDIFHKGQNPQNRIDFFKERGYGCIVI